MGFKEELRKTIPLLISDKDLDDLRLFFMVNMLNMLKSMTRRFDFQCQLDACPMHCCKPCDGWVWETEHVLISDLPKIEACYSGNPLSAFYDPKKGCLLPWALRPVNCHVYICPRMFPIDRVVFDQMVGLPLKALRRFIWEYMHAPNDVHAAAVYAKARGNFKDYPPKLKRAFGIWGEIAEIIQTTEEGIADVEEAVLHHRARADVPRGDSGAEAGE